MDHSTPSRDELWNMLLDMNGGDEVTAGIHLYRLSWFTRRGFVVGGTCDIGKLSEARLSIVRKKIVREYAMWQTAGRPVSVKSGS